MILLERILPGLFSGVGTAKQVTVQSGIAPVAGGNPAPAVIINSLTVGPNIYTGSGAPTIAAPAGSLYLRTDGSSTSTRLYVNTTGSTTWTNVTTAA